MIQNLILITSIIDTPNKPFNYCDIRSVFTRKERFEQTKKTIINIKKFIPQSKILLVECSNFDDEEKKYFYNNCDYILNLWDNTELHPYIFGLSKSLGEGTLTIQAFKYIFDNNLICNNFFKISGRYYLNENFNFNFFNNNNNIICKKIDNDISNISTIFYKLPFNYIINFYNFLNSNINNMINCIGYEILFGLFIKNCNNVIFIDIIGVEGYIAVDKSLNLYIT